MEITGYITENENLSAELYAVPKGVHGSIDHPVTYVESLDTENMVNLRDLESGVYILYGYFHPFAGSDATTIFSQKALVTIVRKDAGTHLQCIYPLNNQIQFASIEVDETAEGGYVYESSSVRMNDVVTVDELDPTLPNPHKLTFSGAVNAEYDGSEAVEVVIPQGGGGGGKWEKIIDATFAGVSDAEFTTDINGNPFALTEFVVWFAHAVVELSGYPYIAITTDSGAALPCMNCKTQTALWAYGAHVWLHADGSGSGQTAELKNAPGAAAHLYPIVGRSSAGGDTFNNYGESISAFKVSAFSQVFAEGTRLIVYGVRA